jgi:hypothetical protein
MDRMATVLDQNDAFEPLGRRVYLSALAISSKSAKRSSGKVRLEAAPIALGIEHIPILRQAQLVSSPLECRPLVVDEDRAILCMIAVAMLQHAAIDAGATPD